MFYKDDIYPAKVTFHTVDGDPVTYEVVGLPDDTCSVEEFKNDMAMYCPSFDAKTPDTDEWTGASRLQELLSAADFKAATTSGPYLLHGEDSTTG